MSISSSDQGGAVADLGLARPAALSGDAARAVFGQVMGLVALTLGCLALGAYIGRDLSGGVGILFFLAGFACVFGLNIASRRGRQQLATTLLFGIVALLVSIPHADLLWSIAGLAIFGGFTVFDFNRLRRTGLEDSVPIAASIFLDVLNVFLFFLGLFGGRD